MRAEPATLAMAGVVCLCLMACGVLPSPASPASPPSLPAGESLPVALAPPSDRTLHLAGSGAMAPLAQALARGYTAQTAAPWGIVVEESLGSGGGARAAADGAVDLGMIARPMTKRERQRGLVAVPLGDDAVVIAANRWQAADAATSADLLALVRGERHTLSGGPAVMLLRDRAESANPVIEALVPGLAAAREAAYAVGERRVLYHDEAMIGALVSTPHALGLASLGVVTSTGEALKVLALDGRMPTLADFYAGRWPATRPMAFVARPERLVRAASFLRFVASPAGAQIMRDSGYRPRTP